MDATSAELPVAEPIRPVETISDAMQQAAFERVETQQYQLVLPAEYETLRGFLDNDGLLSDEEITTCLYDDNLRRQELAALVAAKTPLANTAEQTSLTDYLWDVHQAVAGLDMGFLDTKQTYRITVVDSGPILYPLPGPGGANRAAEAPPHSIQSASGGQPARPGISPDISPVTLHLDIQGGFLANFLHNARLNHQQMNRVIADLEQQHRDLTAPLTRQADVPTPQPHTAGIPLPEQVSKPVAGRPNTAEHESGPSIANQQPPKIGMNQPNQPRLASPGPEPSPEATGISGRPTRYQWADVAPQFASVGITRQDLERAGHLEDLLNGRKTGLMTLTQPGENNQPFQISGKLYIVNTPDNGPTIGIQPERKQLLLPGQFLGYELTDRDKQNLEKRGEMGKRVDLTDKVTGKTFAGYVGVDPDTKSLTVLRAERLRVPQSIKGVTLTKPQQKNLEQGRAIRLTGMTANNGQTFNAYVQVSAAKRSLTFARIPDNAVKQTIDPKTAQDLTRPANQLTGDGAGGKKTVPKKSTPKQGNLRQPTSTGAQPEKPANHQKVATPKPTLGADRPKRLKKQKGPGVG